WSSYGVLAVASTCAVTGFRRGKEDHPWRCKRCLRWYALASLFGGMFTLAILMIIRAPSNQVWVTPNNSFKPKPLRYAKHMPGTACHVLRSTTRLGLT